MVAAARNGRGVTATNFFVHTPICCPSRAELLSGRYLHNIKVRPEDKPQPPKGGNCMHINETKVNNFTFAKYLHEQGGYAVGMFGKFLNNVPDPWGQPAAGYDAWLANGGGEYLSPRFGVKNLAAFTGVADGDDVIRHRVVRHLRRGSGAVVDRRNASNVCTARGVCSLRSTAFNVGNVRCTWKTSSL